MADKFESVSMTGQRLFVSVLLAILLCATGDPRAQSPGRAEESLDVLAGRTEFSSIRAMLPDSLKAIAFNHLTEREKRVAALRTSEEVVARQRLIRETILGAIGGLPERTPLNPRLTGVLKREGYRIEKVIFESRPAFHVTANVYIPETGQAPYPAILLPLGHETGGKSNEDWQRLAVTFARNGFVVLTWDPMGQGERIQLYDPDWGASKVGQATTEHTVAGAQCLLLGHSFARHRIHDGLRALDYLVSRPEVDAAKIGCTGNSGGGTMTSYLSALDDRIKVAAPSCFITSWRSLLETIGPQDAEQNMPPFLSAGMDQADFVIAFAPKPFLIASAVKDFFPIKGARQTYAEVKRLYGLMGAEERLNMVEADDGHGFTLPRRLAAYRWMNRWLRGRDQAITESPVEIESEADLRCTPAGQVTVSLNSETIFSLNRAEAERIRSGRKAPSAGAAETEVRRYQQEVRNQARQLTAFESAGGDLKTKKLGEINRAGYRIEKLTFESAPGIVIPALLFLPDSSAGKRAPVLYLHERGKAHEAAPGGEIEDLARAGAVVLAIDVRGTGETREVLDRSDAFFTYFGAFESAMTAMLVGRTLIGLRAQDIVRAVDLLASRGDIEMRRLTAYGFGDAATALLHAAAMDDRIGNVVLNNMLASYESIVSEKISQRVFESLVPGVLAKYDLPDLAASLAPRRVAIVNPVNPRGQRLELSQLRAQYGNATAAFHAFGAASSLVIGEQRPGQGLIGFFPELQSK
ncbi:MAG: acetylxylan esterase [Blastocatellia bacterium]|nr:acetylxylan esterase [Blastocatellia bacterium]